MAATSSNRGNRLMSWKTCEINLHFTRKIWVKAWIRRQINVCHVWKVHWYFTCKTLEIRVLCVEVTFLISESARKLTKSWSKRPQLHKMIKSSWQENPWPPTTKCTTLNIWSVCLSALRYGKPQSPKIRDFDTRNTDNVQIFHTYVTHIWHVKYLHATHRFLTCILHVNHLYYHVK